MKTLVTLLLILHVVAGTAALLVGLVPMLSRKGSQLHNRAGLVYVYCMIAVGATALLLCGLQPFKMFRLFLTGIAVFSFYLCYTGWRATKNKQGQPGRFDRGLTRATLAVGTGMIAFGTYLISQNGLTILPILFTFFGLLTGLFALKDYRSWQQPTEKMAWYFGHITRMGGSYIATFTAAAVTNVPQLLPANAPEWTATLTWIAPTILGSLIIGRTLRYYKRQFALKAKPVQ